jgi:hypothetical protein
MRLPLLSVLCVRGRGPSTGGQGGGVTLCEQTLRLVFAFAGGSVVRRISWLFKPLQQQ